MEETISLEEIFKLLKTKAILIISMVFVGIGVAAIITFFFITPKYSASAQLIASAKNTDGNSNTDSINSNLLMINTYKDFIKGRVVTEAASNELKDKIGFNGNAKTVEGMLSITQSQNSQMFTINATSTNPTEAAEMANVVAEIFKNEAGEYTEADKVAITSTAEVPTNPISPNKKVNLAIGAILGLIVGVGLALLSQLFNRTVKSSDYVTEVLDIPILGHIPIESQKEIKRIQTEQYDALRNSDFITESIDTTFDLEGESDGLDEDLNRLGQKENLADTIDLSEIDITQVDLDDVEQNKGNHITPIDSRMRRSR